MGKRAKVRDRANRDASFTSVDLGAHSQASPPLASSRPQAVAPGGFVSRASAQPAVPGAIVTPRKPDSGAGIVGAHGESPDLDNLGAHMFSDKTRRQNAEAKYGSYAEPPPGGPVASPWAPATLGGSGYPAPPAPPDRSEIDRDIEALGPKKPARSRKQVVLVVLLVLLLAGLLAGGITAAILLTRKRRP